MAAAAAALRRAARALCPPSRALGVWRTQIRDTHQRASLFSFWELLPTRAEPLRKKKKVDPKKDQAVKERLKKRIRKLEKATQELIPIEDFITPAKLLDKARQRPQVELSFEESERRALLLKKWSLYKQQEHERERDAIRALVAAQQEALQELQLESPELYSEAIKRDPGLFPFEKEGPHYTPPVADYQPPEGRYNDITKVYTQVEFKR
ncbi:large ribosomal subunit protein mL40 [Oryctolagus cuniculus]